MAQIAVAGNSSSESGYFSGGNTYHSNIEKFPFATDTNATDVGDLLGATRHGIGQSGVNHGYHSGGHIGPDGQNVIQKFAFASDQNSTDVGDLTSERQQGAGQQV